MSRVRPGAALLDDVHQLLGHRIRVHFSLVTTLWSVTALTGEYKGRVIAHLDDVTLRTDATGPVEFRVSRAGWERCRRTGKRNVHAWCFGVASAVNTKPDLRELVRVTYNPWRSAWFENTRTGDPVHTADLAVFAKTDPGAEHGYAWI